MLLKRVRKTTTFLSLRVSEDVKKGYEIDADETVLRVIKSIEKEVLKGSEKGEEPGGILPPAPPV